MIKAKHAWKTNVFILSFSNSFTAASYTMIVPFLPLYLMELGANEDDIALYSGAVFSITFLIAAVMAPVWGKMADAHGKKIMGMRALVMLTATYFLGSFANSPIELFGVRLLQGFANGFMPMAMTMASSFSPADKLGYSLGIVHSGMITGSVLGPLIGGVIAAAVGMRNSFAVAGGLLLVITIIYWLTIDEPPAAKKETPHEKNEIKETTSGRHLIPAKESFLADINYAFHNHRLMAMLFLVFVINLANYILQPVISLHIAALLGTIEGAALTSGIVFSLSGISGALSTTSWGKYGQSRGFLRAMALAFAGAGVMVLFQFFANDIYSFACLQFFFGLFFFGANPAVSSLLAQSIPASFQGRAFGLSATAHQTGGMVGPLVGSFIAATIGIRAVFPLTAAMILLFAFILWQRREKPKYT